MSTITTNNRETRVEAFFQEADAVKEVKLSNLEHYYIQKSKAQLVRAASSFAIAAVTGLCLGWQEPLTGFKFEKPLFQHVNVIVQDSNPQTGTCALVTSWFDNLLPNAATVVCYASLAVGVTSIVSSLGSYLNSLTVNWLNQSSDQIVALRKNEQLYVAPRAEYAKNKAEAFATHATHISLY